MAFTPKDPINIPVKIKSIKEATIAQITLLTFNLPLNGGNPTAFVHLAKGNMVDGVFECMTTDLIKIDSKTLAPALTVSVTRGKTRYDEIKDAIYGILQDMGELPEGAVT